MMTAATVAAGAFFQIGFARNAAKLERFGNVFLDGMLKLVQFLLRVQKRRRRRNFQQRVAVLFKVGDFNAIQRLAVVLLFVQRVALAHDGFVLAARGGVGHKGVNALADGRHFRLVHDDLAQFACFFFNFSRHKFPFCT